MVYTLIVRGAGVQNKLFKDTGLKPKSRDNFYPRQDGESYSFKIAIGNRVFYCASMFGTKDAQEKAMQEIIDNWPDKPEIEVL